MDFEKISKEIFNDYVKNLDKREKELYTFISEVGTIEHYKTIEVKDLRNLVEIYEYLSIEIKNLYHLILKNEDYLSEFKKLKKALNKDLLLLIKFSLENEIFFNRCSHLVYIKCFESRFKEYKEKYFDDDLRSFFENEIQKGKLYPKLYSHRVISKKNNKILNDFKTKKIEFIKELYIKKGLNKNEIEDSIILDFENTTATEKIIYLHNLGVIEFLRTKKPFNTSVNSLATVLSAITGAKSGTVQPMLNAMLGKNVDDKNNPLNSPKPVFKVENQLIKIGFNLNETN